MRKSADLTRKHENENVIRIMYRLPVIWHASSILPIPKIKYITSKMKSVRCLFLTRNMGRRGWVSMVGNDQRDRHRATFPADSHCDPRKSTISLSPPHAIKSRGRMEIKVSILSISLVVPSMQL